MDFKDIKDLIITIDKTSIEKVDIEKGDIKISISKGNADTIKKINTVVEDKSPSIEEVINEPVKEVEKRQEENTEDFYIVKSPIVGTFYNSPSPDDDAFVKVGDQVSKGQVLCIIEAMKIMNEIECEASGKIAEFLVNNEDIVEYGQPLMKIRR